MFQELLDTPAPEPVACEMGRDNIDAAVARLLKESIEADKKRAAARKLAAAEAARKRRAEAAGAAGASHTHASPAKRHGQAKPTKHRAQRPDEIGRGQRLLKKGAELSRAGDHSGAIEHYTRALHAEPALFQSYLCRGVSHARRERHERAIADFEKYAARNRS